VRVWCKALWLAVVACLLLLAVAAPTSAHAAPLDAAATSAAGECARGNLLAHATATAGGLPQARLALLTDGVLAREGSPWPSERVVVLVRGQLSFDLGRVVSLEQLYLQLDADQAFALESSVDGTEWTHLPVSASATASGLIFRTFNLNDVAARFVKLRATSEPQTLTLAEVGVVCQREAKIRKLLAVDGPAPEAWEASWSARFMRSVTGAPAVSPDATNSVKLLLVVLAAVLTFGELRRRDSTPVVAWALVALTAAFAYLNFGAYRYPEFVHDHDVFHYFVGAKYFPELGYRDLYACTAEAEAESGFPQRVRLRAQRDLTTNRLESGEHALAQGADCPKHFGARRWDDFRHDVAYFANGRTVPDWHRVLKDHGFNASPTWIALAHLMSEQLQANEHTIGHRNAAFGGIVGALDPLLLLAAAGVAVWAFGIRTTSLVAVAFACNPFAEFSWVGGGFLREAWLSALLIGLCLLKKERFALGGFCLAFSALLQLLPLPTLALPLLAGALCAWGVARAAGQSARFAWPTTAKAWLNALLGQRALGRMLSGATLSMLLLIPLSTVLTGAASGTRVWSGFASNTAKHEATPSGNLLGLGMLLAFRPSTTVDVLIDTEATDPFARTRAAQSATRSRMRPVQGLVIAAALALLAYALRRPHPLWWVAALGLCLVPLGLDASCYYSAWLGAFALVGHRRERLFLPILAALAALLVVKLGVTQDSVQIASASAIFVIAVFTVLVLIARGERRQANPAST
jgi:hypothetical protein